jgi:DMSO reductase iron-sulfur subunit
MQKSFVFDVDKCTGCEACQIACSIENQVERGMSWRRVYTFNPRRLPGVPSSHLSLACNHCADPPCMKYCPALAYEKNPETGAVTIDPGKCIGCKYCSWACPYDAPQFNPALGTMEKCTFCAHRIESGVEPACVALCPTGALGFGDYEESKDGRRVAGFTATEIGPAIRFVARRAEWTLPDRPTAPDPAPVPFTIPQVYRARIGLRTEWTLMVFTFVAAILVGAYAARYIGAVAAPFAHRLDFPPLLFPVLGAVGMAISTLHLGRPVCGWRALLNWRRSWLSREILLFPTFLAAGTIVLLSGWLAGAGGWIGPAAGIVGFAALFCMDRVYHVTRSPGLWTHSAQLLLTGVLFAGLFASNGPLFGAAAALKTFLYLRRKYGFFKRRTNSRPWLTRVRVLIGTAAPMVLWWKGWSAAYPAIVAGALIGELIDRAEFYLELDAPTPSRQMITDLETAAIGRGERLRRTFDR